MKKTDDQNALPNRLFGFLISLFSSDVAAPYSELEVESPSSEERQPAEDESSSSRQTELATTSPVDRAVSEHEESSDADSDGTSLTLWRRSDTPVDQAPELDRSFQVEWEDNTSTNNTNQNSTPEQTPELHTGAVPYNPTTKFLTLTEDPWKMHHRRKAKADVATSQTSPQTPLNESHQRSLPSQVTLSRMDDAEESSKESVKQDFPD